MSSVQAAMQAQKDKEEGIAKVILLPEVDVFAPYNASDYAADKTVRDTNIGFKDPLDWRFEQIMGHKDKADTYEKEGVEAATAKKQEYNDMQKYLAAEAAKNALFIPFGSAESIGWRGIDKIFTNPKALYRLARMNGRRLLGNTGADAVEGYRPFSMNPTITFENAASITPEVTHFYHGSPVRFDAFSADFIGSGEGGSKVMRGINLWPVEKIANAPKLANIKSPDAPLHLGVSSTPLGGKLNPTVYDVSGKGLKLYKAAPRDIKSLKQEDLIKQGYDGVQTSNQVTIFPKSIGKLSIDKQSSIEDFVMSHPEVERWTPWTTDNQKMQNIIDMSKMSKWTPAQWTAAQDAAIAKGDMDEAQRLRDLHFMIKAPNTFASINGKPLQLYHGTNNNFNAFDLSKYGSTDGGTFGRGVYTTPIQEYAQLYGKNNMPLYMKLDNPRDYRDYSIGDLMAEKLAFGEDFSTGNGIDGVIGRPSWKGFKGLEEYVSHNPKNIKSSKAVTFDDNGVRIPLGLRDNFNINDIRYSWLPFILGAGATGNYIFPKNQTNKFAKGGSTQKQTFLDTLE